MMKYNPKNCYLSIIQSVAETLVKKWNSCFADIKMFVFCNNLHRIVKVQKVAVKNLDHQM